MFYMFIIIEYIIMKVLPRTMKIVKRNKDIGKIEIEYFMFYSLDVVIISLFIKKYLIICVVLILKEINSPVC